MLTHQTGVTTDAFIRIDYPGEGAFMRALSSLTLVILLQACKHPLAIVGKGDIVDLNGSSYGCTLEEFQAGDIACTGFDFTEDYIVNYEAVARPGWRFVRWEGPCKPDSIPPYCALTAPIEFSHAMADLLYPGWAAPTTTAVFEELDSDGDGIVDSADEFPLDPTRPVAPAPPNFLDSSVASGIDNRGSNHGVSFGDFNNDGLEDIYIAVRQNGSRNLLYKNLGNDKFEEVALTAKVATGEESTAAVWGDINNDSRLDLYVGNSKQKNRLYLNNGDETFTDITNSAMVGDLGDVRSVQFADVDSDGYIDIYVHNFLTENVLYRNNGDLTFEDITTQSGATDMGPAMGTIFFDYDNDGDQDLYLLNDGTENVLYANDGSGTFDDVSASSGLDFYCSCMGLDIADYDEDGHFDIFVTNYGANLLFRNNGDGSFSEIGSDMLLNDPGVGWGTAFFDYNNDGQPDIHMVNSSNFGAYPNMLYKNNGGVSFTEVSEGSNFEGPFPSFGSATADINNDGSVDFFLANWSASGQGNRLFINQDSANNSVEIKAIGKTSNYSAIGAVIKLTIGDTILMDQVTAGASYASQNSLTLHFGVGNQLVIDELLIKWPSGIEEKYSDLSVNQLYTVTEQTDISGVPFDE